MVAIRIGGTAGMGVESAGSILCRIFSHLGYGVSTQRDFPSRIRGGDTTITVRIDSATILAPPAHIDLALALNDTVVPRTKLGLLGPMIDASICDFVALAKESGEARNVNLVAVGIVLGYFGFPATDASSAISAQFEHKGAELVATATHAVKIGHDFASKNVEKFVGKIPTPSKRNKLLLTGNQAFSFGALAAGCRFVAAYPITPASDILEFMTPKLIELGGVAIQLEDEMAALNACIGAGFSGAAAMTATSGPGLSLMTETIGFAATAEVPCVIVDCQRPGPSTGMPTKHGQEDLDHAIYGTHGEDCRIVMSPLDIKDSFRIAIQAFEGARVNRLPVIVLLDQQLSLMQSSVDALDLDLGNSQVAANVSTSGSAWDKSYAPYSGTTEIDTPRSIPGVSDAIYYANSTEHDEHGFTVENPEIRANMVARRGRLMARIRENFSDAILVEGALNSKHIVVTWGSTMDACREALQDMPDVCLIGIRLLNPFPLDSLVGILRAATGIVVAEANASGQLANLLQRHLPIHEKIVRVNRFDGTPIRAGDIRTALEALP